MSNHRKSRYVNGMRVVYAISEDQIREADPAALLRWAAWLGITPKYGKNPKENFNFLVMRILRAVKRLQKFPKGTIPSDVKGKL